MSVARLLLRNGDQPNSRYRYGLTPLSLAAWEGHAAVVQLLEHGASADPKNCDGPTPLSLAAAYGHEMAARLCWRAGPMLVQDINTARHRCCWKMLELGPMHSGG